MINIFYKLIVKGLIVIKYSGLALRDLFWGYDVNEHADKFCIEVEDLVSSNKLTVRTTITIPRQEFGKQRSFLDTAALLLDNLDTVLDWYTKEEKHDL